MTEETKLNLDETVENQLGAKTAPDSITDNPEASTAELANLRQQLAAKDQEAKENYDRYVRQIAETENF